jgi:hypothetical protein
LALKFFKEVVGLNNNLYKDYLG